MWLGEIDENTFHNIDDPNSERRDKVFLPEARQLHSHFHSEKCWSLTTQMPHSLCVPLSHWLLAHWPSFSLFQNTFVGLTNLGATCYVNTFLQVWFHNLELRRSLYECNNSRAQEHNTDSGISDTCVFQAFVELGFPLSCFFYSYFQIMSPSPSVSICSICLRSCRTATGSTSTPRAWSKLWAWTLASSRYITKLNWWTTLK